MVSEGLLDLLDGDELEAAVAHEIAHLKNRDVAVMTATALPIGAGRRVLELLSGPTTGVEHGTISRADYADALVTVGLLIALPLWICTQLVAAHSPASVNPRLTGVQSRSRDVRPHLPRRFA